MNNHAKFVPILEKKIISRKGKQPPLSLQICYIHCSSTLTGVSYSLTAPHGLQNKSHARHGRLPLVDAIMSTLSLIHI